ncbi:beta-lactamase family protein [Luteimonas yindakuii]|uniref:serine hydrolase domain-containing protein n=1 Tax=Luteimonas yindakuii TaxID=2565782 RepID=UPI0010A51AA4|nr:serine hydrolase domain-containing protein [Luteimonas yindakuii]QCO66663.1 beta-lactamase family protein [Luteimonas yindakuii]
MNASALFALLLLGGVAAGPVHADDSARIAAVDALLHDYTGDVPGVSVLVLHEGRPVLRRSHGLADLEAVTPATPETRYRLASVSKQFTAAAILRMAEEGLLRLDDPVRRWLPELPPATAPVTLHHLLAHTSGLVDYEDLMEAAPAGQVQDADVLALLARADRLRFAPGTAYAYSNSGYVLLGLVAARASGQSFPEVLRTRLFTPLGMDGAVAWTADGAPVRARAWGYSLRDGRWQRTDQSPTSATLGDGGIYASIDELGRWLAALDAGAILSDASRQAMFAAHTSTPTGEEDVDAYGYGWRLHGDMQWHSGETVGFRNVVLRLPRERLAVVVLSNRNSPPPYPLARAIAALWATPGAPTR